MQYRTKYTIPRKKITLKINAYQLFSFTQIHIFGYNELPFNSNPIITMEYIRNHLFYSI